MKFITAIKDIVEYKENIKRQQEILLISPAFTNEEQIWFYQTYQKLIDKCNKRELELIENINVNFTYGYL